MLAGWAAAEGRCAFMRNAQVADQLGVFWSLTDYPECGPMACAGSPDAWRVVDLRPLRDLVHCGAARVSRGLEAMVFGFGAVLLAGGASPGTVELLP